MVVVICYITIRLQFAVLALTKLSPRMIAGTAIPFLCLLCSLFSRVCLGEVSLIQSPKFISRPPGKTAKLLCEVEGESIVNRGVHWYRQDQEQRFHWVLYYRPSQQNVSKQFEARVSLETDADKSCTLSITDMKEADHGTYYCAAWQRSGVKYFGTGTQLMITSRPTKKPSAKILPPSPAEVENNGEGTFLCILNGFFPYIIKVEWAEKGETSSSQLKMETGEIASNDFLVSWLTVSKADLWNKQFECQYWHESNSQSKGYKEKEITNPGIGKAGGPAEGERCPSDIVNSTNIAKSMVLNFSNNVAYITYILLLLKSTCYSSIIVFFIYKMKTASTSHDKA